MTAERSLFERWAGLLDWTPFVVCVAVHEFSLAAALWMSVVLSVLLIARALPHEMPSEVVVATLLAVIGFLIASLSDSKFGTTSYLLLSPVLCSVLCFVLAAGLALRRPFSTRYTTKRVSPAVAETAEFFRFNALLSSVWTVALALATLTAWCGYCFVSAENDAWLVVVIPACTPPLAFLLTPKLNPILLRKAGMPSISKSQAQGEAKTS